MILQLEQVVRVRSVVCLVVGSGEALFASVIAASEQEILEEKRV